MRVRRRDSIIAGNSIRTAFESKSGKIENEMAPFSGSISSSFKIRPESGVCCQQAGKEKVRREKRSQIQPIGIGGGPAS